MQIDKPAVTNGPVATNNPTATNGPATTKNAALTNEPVVPVDPNPARGPARAEGRSSRADYSAFRIIAERNIFDPNRSPRRRVSGGPRPRPRTTESFSLVGTMSYEKGTFAFFDGTSSEYRKVLKVADAIAGYKVAQIAPNSIKLASGTNELELRVGMQMRRDDNGEWFLAGRTGSSYASETPASGPPASATPAPSSEPGAASSSEEEEVLRRLRQRREQELGK
jgi:hypothetical protein